MGRLVKASGETPGNTVSVLSPPQDGMELQLGGGGNRGSSNDGCRNEMEMELWRGNMLWLWLWLWLRLRLGRLLSEANNDILNDGKCASGDEVASMFTASFLPG